MGAGFYAASVLLASSVATRLAGPREGLLAGLLVVFGGPVVWSFLYGSDIALFLFLALWLRSSAGWPARMRACRYGRFRACWWRSRVRRDCPSPSPWPWPGRCARARSAARIDPRPWLPVAAGLAVLALYRLVTGSWLGTSVEDKSLLASYGVNQGLAIASEYGVDVVRGLLLGLSSIAGPDRTSGAAGPRSSSPLALAFIAVAAIVPPRALRRATAAWLAMVAALFALVTPNVFLGAQFQRYVLWAFPGFLALTAAGLGHATTWAIRDPRRERAPLSGRWPSCGSGWGRWPPCASLAL